MSISNFRELKYHIGHQIVCVSYGSDFNDPDNVAIECQTCNEVLLDFDNDNELNTCHYCDQPIEKNKLYCSDSCKWLLHGIESEEVERA